MPFIEMPGGGWCHINTGRHRSKRCGFCSTGWVDKLCDFIVGPRGKTCDAGMCNKCATSIGPEIDHCPRHKGQKPAPGELAL